MAMEFLIELLISAMIVVGGVFALVGSFGLSKLPDLMARLHAPTKATTLGIGGMLIASILYFAFIERTLSVHELLITIFLFLVAPVTAYLVAKTHLHKNRDRQDTAQFQLPPPAGTHKAGWATFNKSEKQSRTEIR
ncbi:Na+/H+ antiporter subunit G [Fodinicurvata fenggangensis]|uniref:Na+/H+ antiporter subunit G n=1 Tax=Fodinicurvata fenggangensis TaxID=1121830 RepID=UPI000AE5B833|nr:Na+/H+ antiporter subunit G [Fodinicurvata fenggangensis]